MPTDGRTELVVTIQPLAKHIQHRSSVGPISYADTFTMTGLEDDIDETSAEQWARAVLGNKPNWLEIVVWPCLLRFTLHHEVSRNMIAGWRISSDEGDESIRLENSSWVMDANIIVSKAPGQVSFSTISSYKSIVGRSLWTALGLVHRWALPRLLRKGAQKICTAR